MNFRNKRGAMEMSVGTIVVIVLLMAVLILGLTLTRTIFRSSTENINIIDQKVKDQVNQLFSEDELRKVVVYPSQYIKIKKGEKDSGFGFSIRNVEETDGTFSYTIAADSLSCDIRTDIADEMITLGSTGNNLNIGAGDVLETPVFVRYAIPDNAPPCQIRYLLNVKKGSSTYGNTVTVDLEILGR